MTTAETDDAVVPDFLSKILRNSSSDSRSPEAAFQDPSALDLSVLDAAQAAQTAPEQSTDALRISERQYRRLFEAARDGILILDSDHGKVTDANPFMTELLGYSHAELLGKELWQIGLLQDKTASLEAFQRLKRDSYIRYEDLPLQNQRGEWRQVEFVSNLYREDGHMVIQCNIRDITDRKRIAAELAAAELAAAEHKSQSAVLEERTRMAREIHDTLAQGFAGIVTQLDAAAAALANTPKPASPDKFPLYQTQWDKAEARIGKARELARESLVEARQSVIALRSAPVETAPGSPEPTPVGEALARFLTQQVQGTTIKSRYVLEGVPCLLPTDAAHCLLRVGQEAIANALAHAHAKEITVELSFDTGQVCLRVRDDGCGFNPDVIEAGRFGIIGMQERAERAGGQLAVHSHLAEGTEVELALPISCAPPASDLPVSDPPAEKASLL